MLRRIAAVVAILVVMTVLANLPGNRSVALLGSEAGRWVELAVNPLGGWGTGMVYDSQSDRSVLVSHGETFFLNRTSNRWVKLDSSPHPRGDGLAAYDSRSDRIVFFGGASQRETWAFDVDTSTWTNLSSGLGPGIHRGGSIAYDVQSDRTILFGGADLRVTNETWAYDFASNTWTNMSPRVGPSPRWLAAMAYDALSDRVLMCGGLSDNGPSYDGWAYDFDGNVWATLGGASCGVNGHAMTYDSLRGRVIMFYGGPGLSASDLLAYDSVAAAWTLLNRTAMPTGRSQASVAYDSARDQLVIFGGAKGPELDDTWTYDFSTDRWHIVSWGTPEWSLHGLAYDEPSARTILVAGLGCGDRTWAYDSEADRWTNMKPDRGYGTLSGRRPVGYDATLDRILCLDGKTWTYDFETNTWTDLNVSPPASLGQSGQGGHAMAYDLESNRMILFGGTAAYSDVPLAETWSFSQDAWTRLTPVSSPPARSFHAIAYDTESDRIVIFGGRGNSSTTLGDTWSYDYNTNRWTGMRPPFAPPPRFDAAATYDKRLDRIVLFGGTNVSGQASNDTWAYDLNANTWAKLASPNDPTLRRYGHSMACDSRADRIILFGGISPYGVHLTWGFELTALPSVPSPGSELLIPLLGVAGVSVAIGAVSILLLLARGRRKTLR